MAPVFTTAYIFSYLLTKREKKNASNACKKQHWLDVQAEVKKRQEEWEVKMELREKGETARSAKEVLGPKPAMPLKAKVLADF